ncbi:hypothetical protein EYF80_031534 [Liparis tanakae]|uniref:Uncharacterized protein n=1 Tax=Liparis tanakae TaxID=230148 RepID=A0A4Z2H013_9TELE|nr:hypothetical protein EYF80_031534 [Liparis tanakae]
MANWIEIDRTMRDVEPAWRRFLKIAKQMDYGPEKNRAVHLSPNVSRRGRSWPRRPHQMFLDADISFEAIIRSVIVSSKKDYYGENPSRCDVAS